MAFDAQFFDGFDSYGPVGFRAVVDGVSDPSSTLIGGGWTQLWATGFAAVTSLTLTVAESLTQDYAAPPGFALEIANDSTFNSGGLSRTLGGTYERIIGGATLMIPVLGVGDVFGICFGDAGVDQCAITIEPSGQLGVRVANSLTGALEGDLIALSSQSIVAGVPFNLDWDVTIGDPSGKARIWLNGVATTVNITGVTQYTDDAAFNQIRLMTTGIGVSTPAVNKLVVDHLYAWLYVSGGGAETPALSNVVIETQVPIADDATDFVIGAAILGDDYSGLASTNAPGANQLFLRKYTPDVDGVLDSVAVLPKATSVSAKFRAAAYADSAGAPAALLSDGVETVGCVSGSYVITDLITPQALTAGTPIWIGLCVDTSIALAEASTATLLGRKVARTYGSGAPNPAGAMTVGQPSWVLFGLVSSVADSWSVIDNQPASGDRSYVWSATPGDQDLYVFPELSSTPTTIYGLAVKIVARRSDAGARTMDILTNSGASTDVGDRAGQPPPTAYGDLTSYWAVDPDTSAAWNASGVNLAKHGFKIAS